MFKRKGIQAETVLLGGHPAERLIEYADERSPDLIVIGARGLRASLGILLGGVAQQVVEYAYWPVLVVKAPYTGLSKILLIVDGSLHNRRAVEYLARFPVPDGCQFRVLHILPPLLEVPSLEGSSLEGALVEGEQFRPYRSVSRVSTSKAYEKPGWQVEEECEGRAILDEALNTLQAAGLQAAGVLLRGDVATEVIEYSKTNGIDLVVGASRGMTQAAGWSLGSVSRKLIHYGASSVLLVR
jgi:nucleotide-binding universal stress UspA family protein